MRARLARVAIVTCFALVAIAGNALASLDSFDASYEELADEFPRLLKEKDFAGLEAFLSPQLLVQRANGRYETKEDYLKSPSRIDEYVVTDVVGQSIDNIRVVRYTLSAVESIGGLWVTRDPMPRLSTFIWSGERWQLVAHANFVPMPPAP